MGHLINPVGFRVGQSRSWVDNWFAYNDVYPEFLHFVLKIRFFLNAVLFSIPSLDDLDWSKNIKSLFRSAIIYSHFNIIFNFSTIFISLYYYPGKFWDNLMDRQPRRFSSYKFIFKSFFVSEKDFVKDLPFFFKDFHLKIKRFIDQSWIVPFKYFNSINFYNKFLTKSFKKRRRYFKNYFKTFINLDKKDTVTVKTWNKYFSFRKFPWKKYSVTKRFEGRYLHYYDRSLKPYFNLNSLIKRFFFNNRTGFYLLLLFLFFFKPFSVINNFKDVFAKSFFKSSNNILAKYINETHFFKFFFTNNFNAVIGKEKFKKYFKYFSIYGLNFGSFFFNNFFLYLNWSNLFCKFFFFFKNFSKFSFLFNFFLKNNRFFFYRRSNSLIFKKLYNIKDILKKRNHIIRKQSYLMTICKRHSFSRWYDDFLWRRDGYVIEFYHKFKKFKKEDFKINLYSTSNTERGIFLIQNPAIQNDSILLLRDRNEFKLIYHVKYGRKFFIKMSPEYFKIVYKKLFSFSNNYKRHLSVSDSLALRSKFMFKIHKKFNNDFKILNFFFNRRSFIIKSLLSLSNKNLRFFYHFKVLNFFLKRGISLVLRKFTISTDWNWYIFFYFFAIYIKYQKKLKLGKTNVILKKNISNNIIRNIFYFFREIYLTKFFGKFSNKYWNFSLYQFLKKKSFLKLFPVKIVDVNLLQNLNKFTFCNKNIIINIKKNNYVIHKNVFFNSYYLKKSRLFFFFKFFFKFKKNLIGYFKKNSFLKQHFLKYPIKEKGLFLVNERIDLPFFFFFIWVFSKKLPDRYKSAPKLFRLRADKWDSDYLQRQNRKKLAYKHYKRKKKFGFWRLGYKFIIRFFRINWDFLITYLIDNFFFKYNVDIKYILLFIFFFKDLIFSSPFSSNPRKSNNLSARYSFQTNDLCFKLLNIQIQNISKISDYSYEPFIHSFVPFENIKIKLLLIDNHGVSSWFLVQYFGIRLLTGHSVKMLVNPVIKDLRKIVLLKLVPMRKSFFFNKIKGLNFLKYRSSLFKYFILKNFSLYKFLYMNFFKVSSTFFNYYLIWFFSFFFSNFSSFYNYAYLIGVSRSFFLRKHAYNFFFNYDFNSFLERIFTFFSLVLLNFHNNEFFYFNVIFDELFSNFNIIFFSSRYFEIDLSSIKTASFFFNKVIIYNYWFSNMHWLHNANNLNKLRGRLYPLLPLGGNILGFKFHFRGRFSRKQRAGSFIFEKGNMPLNTISANIDYAFLTVPLANSLISIKIWLLKHPFFLENYKSVVSNFKIFPKQVKNLVYTRILNKLNFNFKEFKRKREEELLLKQQETLLEDVSIKKLVVSKIKKFRKKRKKFWHSKKIWNSKRRSLPIAVHKFMGYLEIFFFSLLFKGKNNFLFFFKNNKKLFFLSLRKNLQIFNKKAYTVLYHTEISKINPKFAWGLAQFKRIWASPHTFLLYFYNRLLIILKEFYWIRFVLFYWKFLIDQPKYFLKRFSYNKLSGIHNLLMKESLNLKYLLKEKLLKNVFLFKVLKKFNYLWLQNIYPFLYKWLFLKKYEKLWLFLAFKFKKLNYSKDRIRFFLRRKFRNSFVKIKNARKDILKKNKIIKLEKLQLKNHLANVHKQLANELLKIKK